MENIEVVKAPHHLEIIALPNGYEFRNYDQKTICFLSLEKAHLGILNDNYYGYVSSEELLYIMQNYYVQLIQKYRLSKKLCNVQAMEGAAFDMIKNWYLEVLLPKMIETGLRKNALVIPEEFFAQLTMELYQDEVVKVDELFLDRTFGKTETAVEWLLAD